LHEPLVPGPTVTALLMRMAPTVGTFHAAGDSTSYRVLNRTARWAANHIDVRVAVSEQARELAARYLDGDYQVLFNGIEVSRYRRPDIERVKEPAIFFCARYEPRKGLEILLEALDSIPRNVRLWVASDGPGISELRQRHAGDNRIEWLGRVTEEEKIRRLASCTVFCAPSLHSESFGIVLLEAMAAQAPLVASSLDGYCNVAKDGRDALLVEPGDSVLLADALNRMLTDKPLAMRLVEGGARRADQFSMNALAQEYFTIYRRLLNDEANMALMVAPSRLLSFFNGRSLRRSQTSNSA
ncbi:MAG: glycosyltransferase family 4 protein, partial [Ilumatobacteraceae bacterium]